MSKPEGTYRRFASVLRQAMRVRAVRQIDLQHDLGVGRTTVYCWRAGMTMPRLDMAGRLADRLDWPSIIERVLEERARPCVVCGVVRVHDALQGRYCSRRCQTGDHTRRGRGHTMNPARLAQSRLPMYVDAVDELCRKWCEPEGQCRDATCPVQKHGLSPLPLAPAARRTA